MPFSQATITALSVARDGAEMYVSWQATDPPGTTFQLYLGRRLAWLGTARAAHLPWPAEAATVDVGTVLPDEATTDFSGSLPAAPANRASLEWQGGTYLSDSLVGFRIYRSAAAGGAVDMAAAIDTVIAYPGGLILDGAGFGRAGHGGAGRSESSFSWTSGPLGNGTWTFAVQPFDAAGNAAGSPLTATATIAAPPKPPAADATGKRLSHAYDSTAHTVTLSWLASPG